MRSELSLFTDDFRVSVTISAKSAMLPFQGCTLDYIRNICHGRCCWTTGFSGKPTTTIYVEEDQRAAIEVLGGVFDSGVIRVSSNGRCRFQDGDGFCELHCMRSESDLEIKPRSCYISPWVLTKNNRLIIRNRYKLLRCFKTESAIPAYKAFYSGLVMLFGAAEAVRIAEHFYLCGGDYKTSMPRIRSNLVHYVMSTWHNGYYVQSRTPVEKHGKIWMKRDDYACGGLGAKARAITVLLQGANPKRVVTCGSRRSVQVMVCAKICAALGLPLLVHTASGKNTRETTIASRFGATIVRHSPGYLTVIRKRAEQDVLNNGGLLIPFGLFCERAIDLVSAEACNLPVGIKRVIVCGGTGVTAAGVLLGTKKIGVPVLVVEVGMSTSKTIRKFAGSEFSRVTIIPPESPYEKRAIKTEYDSVQLDPLYEAKCLPYLLPGDLLWVTANRRSILGGNYRERL